MRAHGRNSWHALALLLFVAGVTLLVWGVSRGEVRFALFLIFPVFYGSGGLAFLAFALLIGAMIAWFAGSIASARTAGGYGGWEPVGGRGGGSSPYAEPQYDARYEGRARRPDVVEPEVVRPGGDAPREGRRRVRGGGVVFLGPIPIVFGSDKRIARTMMILGLILVLGLVLLSLLGR